MGRPVTADELRSTRLALPGAMVRGLVEDSYALAAPDQGA